MQIHFKPVNKSLNITLNQVKCSVAADTAILSLNIMFYITLDIRYLCSPPKKYLEIHFYGSDYRRNKQVLHKYIMTSSNFMSTL